MEADQVNSIERNGADKPVIGLDIDGTLGDYHGHFLKFAEGWFGRRMPGPEEVNPGLPLYRFMRVTKRDYRECKLAYRQGGMKRTMPVYPGADLLTKSVRAAGAEIWLCTTRPWQRLDNIDPDTREWLRRNKVEYDYVLYGEDKYEELERQAGKERVIAIVDDLPEMVFEAAQLGLGPRYLRNQPYNEYATPGMFGDYQRFDDLGALRNDLLFLTQGWLFNAS
jgi:hypothetical protein